MLKMSVMLMMLMMTLLTINQAISVTDGEVPGQGGGVAGYREGVPPVLNQTSSSCPCNKLVLSSLGPAAQFQPLAMAVYTKSFFDYKKHPAYRMDYGVDYRLYFTGSGWLVGDKQGKPKGYIHSPNTSNHCPYMIGSGWQFYSSAHGAWYQDNTLTLRCIPH